MVNGIRLPDTLLNEQECENEKRKMAFGKDEKVILFVGRLDEIKGVSLIIQAFKGIREKLPDAHLLLVGDGNYDKYLPVDNRYLYQSTHKTHYWGVTKAGITLIWNILYQKR